MDPNLFTVAPNAQLTYETLRIGFGAVESGDYLDKEGIEVSGNFVYIWPFLKGEEKGRPSMLVYEGLTVEIENYLVEIIEIKKGEIQVRILTKNASE